MECPNRREEPQLVLDQLSTERRAHIVEVSELCEVVGLETLQLELRREVARCKTRCREVRIKQTTEDVPAFFWNDVGDERAIRRFRHSSTGLNVHFRRIRL